MFSVLGVKAFQIFWKRAKLLVISGVSVLSRGLNGCFYSVAIVTCNNNVTPVHIVSDQLRCNVKAKNCTNRTEYSVLCVKRMCIYQLILVLWTVSESIGPK